MDNPHYKIISKYNYATKDRCYVSLQVEYLFKIPLGIAMIKYLGFMHINLIRNLLLTLKTPNI